MMKILLEDLGKKFNNHWIFKGLNYELESSKSYAILGSNGSGKSTLLKIISGFMTPTAGSVKHFINTDQLDDSSVYRYVSGTAPYTEVYEELNLVESFEFQARFKPMTITKDEFIEKMDLPVKKTINEFSSGMKQKLKLGLTIFSKSPLLMFDEPTNNLDQKARTWFIHNIEEVKSNKLIVVCSNYLKEEYSFCSEMIEIDKFKADVISV